MAELNQSASFSSDSGNFFTDSSHNSTLLFGLNASTLPNRQQNMQHRRQLEQNSEQPQQEKVQELFIQTQLLDKYPQLFKETVKILEQRAEDPQLRKLAKEWKNYYDEAQLREQLQQQGNNFDPIPQPQQHVFSQLQKVRQQIHKIEQQKNTKVTKILQLQKPKVSNSKNLQMLVKMVQDLQTSEYQPFNNVDQEYMKTLKQIIQKYKLQREGKLERSTVEDPSRVKNQQQNQEELNLTQIMNQKLSKRLQQIQNLKTQIQLFTKLTHKQTKTLQELKQKIKLNQQSHQQVYKQITKNQSNQICFKRQILCDMIQGFIQKQSKQKDYNHGLQIPMQEYLDNISRLQKQIRTLHQQFQQQISIKTEKINKNSLLQKKLQQLHKEIAQVQKAEKNNEVFEEIKVKQRNNEELLLKTYEIQDNKIRNEKLAFQTQQAKKQLDQALKNQSKAKTLSNNRVIVDTKPQGFFQRYLPIKNPKTATKVILIIWSLILAYYFAKAILIKLDYLPAQTVGKMPRTIVHRYQGKHRIVDGEVVNITHRREGEEDEERIAEDENSVKEDGFVMIQDQVIVVQPLSQQHGATWTDMLKMEYQ